MWLVGSDLNDDTGESTPDMHLIYVIPEIKEVFFWSLFVHLSHIVHERVDQANAHEKV